MPAPVVRLATHRDSRLIKLRDADLVEIAAMTGHDQYTALELSRVKSDWAYAVELDGEPIAMFGVAANSLLPDWGSPWLLGSDQLKEISISFLRGSQEAIAEMFENYRVLQNFVHADNQLSINWLTWLGFHFFGPYPIGKKDEMFYEFMRLR